MIVTIGTRGDVQPYIALGQALMESGNEVTICTCAHFEPFIRENSLGYAYVNNDFIDFMHTPEGKIILGNAGTACKETAPDLILYHMKAVEHVSQHNMVQTISF
ncbi:glycosyltransferase [Desulfobacula sp.]|uniref:glycosyltransferase n=1 Tax=Desulfobacula sp. TaxID=2593537 RepID=UPI00261E80BD|nr:glycosyltransferase [Desulfobacula sp.]